MIDKKFAATEIERLVGLKFFPTTTAARKELIVAAQSAPSEAVLSLIVGEWAQHSTDAPKPAELRRQLHEKAQANEERRKKCDICNGEGVVTVWKLVTYMGQSFTMKTASTLKDITTNEQAQEFSRKLAEHIAANPKAERQTVLTAAKNCICRVAA